MTIREMAVNIARLAGGVHDNLVADVNKAKVLIDVEGIDALAREIIGAEADRKEQTHDNDNYRF